MDNQVKEIFDEYHTQVKELLDEYPDLLFATGFESAILGLVSRFDMRPVVLYDRDECIRILMHRDGASYMEAVEYFEVNVIGSWMGDMTPAFATMVNFGFPLGTEEDPSKAVKSRES